MPELCSQLDSTSLFMLQLACILNMVSVWKRATLRVFLCSTVTDAAENDRRKSRLDDLLAQLRIHALTVLVPMESVRDVINRPIIKEEDLTHYQSSYTSQEVLNVSDVYLRAVNQMIKNHSEQASLCFLYLPAPPKLQAATAAANSKNPFSNDEGEKTPAFITTSENDLDKSYIRMLETVSEGLPPTVYINGVNCVTSTQLWESSLFQWWSFLVLGQKYPNRLIDFLRFFFFVLFIIFLFWLTEFVNYFLIITFIFLLQDYYYNLSITIYFSWI